MPADMGSRRRWLWVVPILVASCGITCRAPLPDASPEWLVGLVERLEREPVANPPATIVQYRYQGATVYYLPPRCCDVESALYNAAGDLVCSPDGGLTGRGDGKCPDFFTEARVERVVWRDRRGPG
jgi:hypothetical protein